MGLSFAALILTLGPAVGQAPGRPGQEGEALEIAVGAYLLDLIDINDVEKTFTADFVIGLEWRDPRLADPRIEDEREIPLDRAWHPEIAVLNERSLTPKLRPYLLVEPDGHVRYAQRYLGTFSVALDLADFPFDHQVLPVEIVVARYKPKDIVCVPNEKKIGREKEMSITGWQVKTATVVPGVKKFRVQGVELAAVYVHMKVSRERWFYIWKIIFPLVLIVFMSSAVFWIPPSLIPSQIAIATASVLTLIAFYLTIGTLLPRISYMTRMDFFVIGCTAIVFLAFGEAVTTGYLASSDRVAQARKLDRWARVVFLVVFAMVAVLAFLT